MVLSVYKDSPGLTLEPIPLAFRIQNFALRLYTLHLCWSFRLSSSLMFCLFSTESIGGHTEMTVSIVS